MAKRSDPRVRRIAILFAAIAVSLILHGCDIGCWFAPCDKTIAVTAIVTDSSELRFVVPA